LNFRYMLGSYNTLNTSKIYFYSKKFKDITISNQQVAKNNVDVLNFSILIFQLWRYMCFFGFLRDYTRKVILLFRRGWLRYSPAIRTLNTCNYKGVFVDKDKNNKLDPLWVTGRLRSRCWGLFFNNNRNWGRKAFIKVKNKIFILD